MPWYFVTNHIVSNAGLLDSLIQIKYRMHNTSKILSQHSKWSDFHSFAKTLNSGCTTRVDIFPDFRMNDGRLNSWICPSKVWLPYYTYSIKKDKVIKCTYNMTNQSPVVAPEAACVKCSKVSSVNSLTAGSLLFVKVWRISSSFKGPIKRIIYDLNILF